MTAPTNTTTVRVSLEMRDQIMAMAKARRQTADEVLADLLNPSTVIVPLTRVQHQRWREAAAAIGVTLAQFVSLRVEYAMGGMDASMLERMFYTVRAIAQHHGVRAADGIQQSTDDLPQSTGGLQQ
jgi:hypothetical protein